MAISPSSHFPFSDQAALSAWPEYQTLFDIVPDAIFVLSAEDGTFLALNPAFEALSGWPAERWIGKPFAPLVHPDDLPLAAAKFRDALLNRLSPAPYELRIRSATGEYLIGEIRGAPIIVDGRVVGKIGVARDISERKRVEGGLRFLSEASATLSSSLDYGGTLSTVARLAARHIADWCVVDVIGTDGAMQRLAVAHRDPAKQVLLRELQELYNCGGAGCASPREVVLAGRSILIEELSDEQLQAMTVDERQRELIKGLGTHSLMRVPMVARDQTIGVISFVVGEGTPHYSHTDLLLAEELAHLAAIAVDNARLYEEAQNALRLRDEFLAIAAHELRGPISALSLQTQVLQRTVRRAPLNVERITRAVDANGTQIERLGGLVDRLLDVSRFAAGRLELEPKPTDLTALVAAAVERFAEESAEANTPIVLHASEPITGVWDADRLDQVCTNLISNALKYGRGSVVEIEVAGTDTEAILRVRDHGVGIPLGRIDHIFDRFERAHDRKNFKGLGLGLYIVREIVEAHGGSVRATSIPEEGSTFTVVLPRIHPS